MIYSNIGSSTLRFGALTVAGAAILGACGSGDTLVADAGADLTITIGEAPSFDGCESRGEINNYAWTIVSSPDAVAGDNGKVIRESSSDCSFTLDTAMISEEAGLWAIELTVSDTDGVSSSDTVEITVEP